MRLVLSHLYSVLSYLYSALSYLYSVTSYIYSVSQFVSIQSHIIYIYIFSLTLFSLLFCIQYLSIAYRSGGHRATNTIMLQV